jgi:hypothetical protein
MVPLPANVVRGMYSHMFKRLSFKGYLQEKGSLAIDPEGSQDPTHSEEQCNPGVIILVCIYLL